MTYADRRTIRSSDSRLRPSARLPACPPLLAALAILAVLAVPPLSAQTDPSGTWRTMHTAHFRVHFRPGALVLAGHAADEGERAWSLLAREIPPPHGKVDLILSDAADFSNGATSVFPPIASCCSPPRRSRNRASSTTTTGSV